MGIFLLGVVIYDLFDTPHLPTFQADLDSMRMMWRFGEDLFDDALGQFASALILLQDDEHGHARFDIGSGLAVHNFISCNRSEKR